MSYLTTGQAVMTVLKQTVYNLDVQRDQLVESIERDYDTAEIRAQQPSTETEARLIAEHLASVEAAKEQIHRDLYNVFAEIARAREHLVDAHNLLRDVVAPIDLRRPVR